MKLSCQGQDHTEACFSSSSLVNPNLNYLGEYIMTNKRVRPLLNLHRDVCYLVDVSLPVSIESRSEMRNKTNTMVLFYSLSFGA